MLVEAPHRRVAEENATAPVGLQSMLVRVDDDGVRLTNRCVCPPRRIVKRLWDQQK